MKQVILVALLLTAICAQAVKPVAPVVPAAPAKPSSSRPPVYQDDVIVNLPEYKKENDRIRKSLDANIATKKALVVEGNAHNANLKTVTGYVDAWKSDIDATEKATNAVVTGGKTTRTQWNVVKETQNPNAKAPEAAGDAGVKGKKMAVTAKKTAKRSAAKKFKRNFKYTAAKGAKNAKFMAGAKKAFAKMPVAKKVASSKPVRPTTAKKTVAKKAGAKVFKRSYKYTAAKGA